MNAETRAKEIMAWLRQECSDSICTHLDCPSCGCMAYITTALRQAENDKLEEAARAVDALEIPRENYRLGGTYWSVHVDTLDEASTAIRSLIQKD